LTKGHITATRGRYNGIRQVATVCTQRFHLTHASSGPTQMVFRSVQPFLGDRLQNGSPYAMGPLSMSVCLQRCVLWPNGWMDQDATWYGGRLRPRRQCVRWERSPISATAELLLHSSRQSVVGHACPTENRDKHRRQSVTRAQ